MFVVCAQAPGRIDGVLVVLVVEVLITTHSACLVMRAAHKELAQLACGHGHGSRPRRRLCGGAGRQGVKQTAPRALPGLLGDFISGRRRASAARRRR